VVPDGVEEVVLRAVREQVEPRARDAGPVGVRDEAAVAPLELDAALDGGRPPVAVPGELEFAALHARRPQAAVSCGSVVAALDVGRPPVGVPGELALAELDAPPREPDDLLPAEQRPGAPEPPEPRPLTLPQQLSAAAVGRAHGTPSPTDAQLLTWPGPRGLALRIARGWRLTGEPAALEPPPERRADIEPQLILEEWDAR